LRYSGFFSHFKTRGIRYGVALLMRDWPPWGMAKNKKATEYASGWFVMLERARLDGDREREQQAIEELERLGVKVTWTEPPSESIGGRR
jgi:hypothetical protein